MMKITIIEDAISSRFQKTLQSLKLDKFIRIGNAKEDDSFQISVQTGDNQIMVECIELDFHETVSKEEDVEISLLKCCGYKCIKLTGMTVRDSNGVKIKPVIEVFVKASHLYDFPDTLEFSKGTYNELLASEEIYFNSEILGSVLDTANLFFRNGEKLFEIALEKKQHSIKYKRPPPALCMDFLFNITVTESFLKHHEIAKKYSIFNNFVSNKPENLVFSKSLYKKINNSEKDLRDLMDFVEHAPKFQDGRDGAIDELKEFLIENYPTAKGHKYEYLEVFKQAVPKNKNKHSLKKFLEL